LEENVKPRSRWWISLFALLALVAAACGTSGEGEGDGDGDARTVIRFAFAPDPVWDYMNDNGVIVEWEEEHNIRVVTSTTWDEFTFFAGGHGDIVSMGSMEIPVLEQETGINTVSFGKYNALRDSMMTTPDTGFQTLADVPPGSTICVASPVSASGFWGVAADELHGLDFRVGGGDFELIVNDHFVNPQNMVNGDCVAAILIPEAAASFLRTGEIVMMYDGQSPFQLYNTFSGFESAEAHIMSNLFTATEEFYDAHTDEIAAFLDLWQRGIELWEENQAEIISTYPQHFAVEAEEDVAFIQEFMAGPNNWFVDSVYFTDEWVEAERAIWDFQVGLHEDNPNKLAEGFTQPRLEVVPAP
jgi:ABC-type nitrate/sulfonate/bicarbonate transport system substrate-binding protein